MSVGAGRELRLNGVVTFIAGPEGLEELPAVGGTKLDRGALCITGKGFCADFFTM